MKVKVILIILLLNSVIYGQKYDRNYLATPLKGKLRISSNFGELRPNHFHAGLDVKTKTAGLKLRSAANGYVSRIKISSYGYGNVLYITHPNGLETVYAHMLRFNKKLWNYAKQIQYQKESYYIDIYPDSALFPVKKYDFIGLSGNSGHSFGAHLHYEVREAEKDVPINPQYFYKIIDKIAPTIKKLVVYPQNDNSFVNGKNKKTLLNTKNLNKTIKISGNIGFGIEAFDKVTDVPNKFGIYSITLYLDSKEYFSYSFDKISFYESRYINSLEDYEAYKKKRQKIYKCFLDKGNKLDVYKNKTNNGIIKLNDNKKHIVKIVAKDYINNKKTIKFYIQKDLKKYPNRKKKSENYMNALKDNFFVKDDIRIILPKGSLYKDINFTYKKKAKKIGLLSDIHKLHNSFEPIHKHLNIAIKPENLPNELKNKALIIGYNSRGRIYSAGGSYIKGFICTEVRSFGSYAVAIDTVAPKIKLIKRFKSSKIGKSKRITFKITDNLSGIKSYKGYIDGNFVLFKYNARRRTLTYTFDNHITYKKNHILKLEVVDNKQNKTVFEKSFYK